MKVAVPNWHGRVSPVFDVATQVLLVDLDGEDGGSRRTEKLDSRGPHDRARRLAELGVNVLVCGAISWPLEALLAASGIRVVALVRGDVEEVVEAFRKGALKDERFVMPGCCRNRRRACNRRRGAPEP